MIRNKKIIPKTEKIAALFTAPVNPGYDTAIQLAENVQMPEE